MAKLTDRACANTKQKPDGDVLLGDGNGLYLRIRPGGSRVWIVDYLVKGKRRKVSIGNYHPSGSKSQTINGMLAAGILSLAEARLIAAEWKQLRRAGRDPAAEWEIASDADTKAREAEAAQPTMSSVVELFMAQHMNGKKSADAVSYRLTRLANIIGDKKIREVTKPEVIAALEKIAEGRKPGRPAKQLAGEVLTTAKRLWDYAESRDWVAANCLKGLTRAHFDARPNKRDVVLGLDELAEVWRALGDPVRCKADPVTVAAMRLLILTGQREREVTDAEWREFDLDSGIWRIPASRTKMGRSHLVHLAPETIVILKELQALTGHQQFVFASPLKADQPIYGRSVNNALLSMFKRDLLPNITPCHVHDFRRTLITRLPDLGFEPFIGHKIANHKLPGVLAHYNHNEYMRERESALKAWANLIASKSDK